MNAAVSTTVTMAIDDLVTTVTGEGDYHTGADYIDNISYNVATSIIIGSAINSGSTINNSLMKESFEEVAKKAVIEISYEGIMGFGCGYMKPLFENLDKIGN